VTRRERRIAVIGAAALLLATAGLFVVSRGKWSDAIIDSGREWIVPDALARGELLYRDVVYWFGPFTPYFHAAFFKIFGSSFQTLVLAGIVGSIGVLAPLYFALRRVTERREAALWTALAIPVLVFMPNAGGSILGMGYRIWHAAAFALAAIFFASRDSPRGRLGSAAAAGVLAAMAGLCRTEWGVAALAASLLTIFVRHADFDGKAVGEAGTAVGSALAIFSGTYLLFAAVAGPAAIFSDAPVLLFGLPEETRRHVAFAGWRAWPGGILVMLYSLAMWAGAYVVVEIAALARGDRGRMRRRAPLLFLILAALAVLSRWASADSIVYSAAPAICLAALIAGVRHAGRSGAASAAGFALLGLVLSFRRPFHIADAPYVAPPLLFALCSAAALVQGLVAREADASLRSRLSAGIAAAVAGLTVLAFVGRAVSYRADGRVAVPGTDGMLSAEASTADRIAGAAAAVRRCGGGDRGLAVFPEGEVLNLLTGRPNPLRHKLYLPGYLTARNERAVLDELRRTKPIVVVWPRPVGEYGGGNFGEHYGKSLRDWIERSCVPCPGRADEKGRDRARVVVAAPAL
jgi:hypothetical protein